MVKLLNLQSKWVLANHLSLHKEGRDAQTIIDESADKIADVMSVKGSEIIFTSNATEANILAVNGFLNSIGTTSEKRHAIISGIEHDSMSYVEKILENNNFDISIAQVNSKGIVTKEEIERLLNKNTVFVSVIKVSNEIGTIQPVYEIAKAINNYEKSIDSKIMFHVDASQAFKVIELKPSAHGIDFLTICSSKIGGPQGVSALFVKTGSNFESLFSSVDKFSVRPGTLSVVLIVGFAEAFYENSKIVAKSCKKYREMQLLFIKEMSRVLPSVKIHTVNKPIKDIKEKDLVHISPSLLNIYIEGIDHDYLSALLDDRGFSVSTRSACSSICNRKSRALSSLESASGELPYGLRIGFNDDVTKSSIVKLVNTIKDVLELAKSK